MDVEPGIASKDGILPAWRSRADDPAVEATISVDVRTGAKGSCVSVRRQMRRGADVLAERVAWCRVLADGTQDEFLEAVRSMGAGLAFVCEAAEVLSPGYVDALIDARVKAAIARRREDDAKAAEARAEAEREERAAREIHVFFRGRAARMLAAMLDPHRSGRWFDERMRTVFDLSAVSWIIQTPEVTPPVAALVREHGALFEARFQTGLLEELRRLAIAIEMAAEFAGGDEAAVEGVFVAFRGDFLSNDTPAARLLAEHARGTCLRQGHPS